MINKVPPVAQGYPRTCRIRFTYLSFTGSGHADRSISPAS